MERDHTHTAHRLVHRNYNCKSHHPHTEAKYEMADNSKSSCTNESDLKRLEKEEEAKLKAKYPSVSRPGPGFLQKRLQKGVSV